MYASHSKVVMVPLGIQKCRKKELSIPWHTNSVSISTVSRTISLTRSSLSFVHQWRFRCIPRLLSFQKFSLVACVCSLSALVIKAMEWPWRRSTLPWPTTKPLNSTTTYNKASMEHNKSFVNTLQFLSVFCSLFLCRDYFNSISIFLWLTLFLASGCVLD